MAEKDYLNWVREQAKKHAADDKISNLDKLSSKYIINKYKTWGELFDSVGIKSTYVKEKAKASTSPKERTLDDVDTDLAKWQMDIDYANMRMDSYPTSSAEYKEAKAIYDAAVPKVKALKAEAQSFQLGKQGSSIDEDIAKKEEELKKAKDRGQDTKSIEKQLNDLKTKKSGIDTKIAAAKTAAGTDKPLTSAPGPDVVREGVSTTTAPAATTTKATTTPKPTTTKPTGTKPAATTPTKPAVTDAQQREEALNIAAGADFALPETIFNNVPELKKLLNDYVNSDKYGGQWTLDTFRKKLRDTNWFRKNSVEIRNRYVQLYNYQDLVKTGQAQGTTDYEKQIATLERQIADKARTMGSGIASDPAALRRAAENMYITNVGIDDAMTTDFIAAAIRPLGSMLGGDITTGYSGQALQNYQTLQSIAKSNGFKLTDIIPGNQTESQILQGLATGKIDINRIAQDARVLASQGQPQYVRDLLSQGYNLSDVYAPYRRTMATALELEDDQIDLNDPTLRMAITDKGDMNIYEFNKLLRKDNRWQYTGQARNEVADATQKILQDFGFMG